MDILHSDLTELFGPKKPSTIILSPDVSKAIDDLALVQRRSFSTMINYLLREALRSKGILP